MRGNGSFRLGVDDPKAPEGTGATPAGDDGSDTHPPSVTFSINQRELEDATTLVTVEGELDLASAPSLKWALTDAVQAGARQMVLDLSPVTFIDSTALGVLVGVHRSLAAGTRMAIAGADADVLNIFELTGLDSTFDMFSTLDEALAWVRGSEAATG
jgi:anti-sigma B factor antagonist